MGGALLFDLDGTLVDTDALHHDAFNEMLAEDGMSLSADAYRETVQGRANVHIFADLYPGREAEFEAMSQEKEARFRARLGREVPPMAGIHRLLDWAEAEGVGTAVVTNAMRPNAEAMLAASGLDARLTELVIADELARPKPDPLPYRTAMERLGVRPSHAIAFEDSRSGLRAARTSGAFVFGMTTGHGERALREAGAHAVIDDFEAPGLWAHLATFSKRIA